MPCEEGGVSCSLLLGSLFHGFLDRSLVGFSLSGTSVTLANQSTLAPVPRISRLARVPSGVSDRT